MRWYFKLTKTQLGIALATMGALLLSIITCLEQLAASYQITTLSILFLQSTFGLGVISLYGFHKMGLALIRTLQLKTHVIRGILGILGVFGCLFWSLQALPASTALVLNRTSPLFKSLLLLFFRQRINTRIALLLVIGFLGIIVILNPSKTQLNLAAFCALASGFFTALIMLILKHMAKSEPILTMIFYYCLISAICSGVMLFFQNQIYWNEDTLILGCVMGIFFVVYQFCVYSSLRYVNLPIATSLYYTTIAFSALIGFLMFHHTIGLREWVGIALIALSALWLINIPVKHYI